MHAARSLLLVAAACVTLTTAAGAQLARPRARDLGVAPGVFPPGPLNAITDVEGVAVGHTTLTDGAARTGVTVVVPHPGNTFQDKVAGAVFVGNAFGKLAGSTQVEELGTIETPIVLTNTLSVGTAVEAVVRYVIEQPGNAEVRSVNALVGETNDGGLNDIRSQLVTGAHVVAALRGARGGAVEEGSVGAGTGTQAFGWKGGIGTSSRVLPAQYGSHRVGVLVQSNFGGVLTIDGAPVGKELGRYAFGPPTRAARDTIAPEPRAATPDPAPGGAARVQWPTDAAPERKSGDEGRSGDGSCMIVVATDAPLDARDLTRLAARAVFALGRTGSSYSNGSGDFAVAFSTSPELRTRFGETAVRTRAVLPAEATSPLFQAVLEATEEAVYNSLFRATTVSGQGRTVEALPIERVREILKKYGHGGPSRP